MDSSRDRPRDFQKDSGFERSHRLVDTIHPALRRAGGGDPRPRLTDEEVESLASDPTLKILQTSSRVDAPTWALLNESLFALRHDVELRITSNLSALAGMVRIQRLGLCQVRGLTDISVISTSIALEFLALRSLARIQALPICPTFERYGESISET